MKFRFASTATAAALLFSGLVATAPAANAETPPIDQMLYVSNYGVMQNPSADTLYGTTLVFTARNGVVPAGAYAVVSYSSCGQLVQSAQYGLPNDDGDDKTATLHYFSANGQPDLFENQYTRKIGRSLDYSVTIVHPGYDGYTYSGTITGYSVNSKDSCDKIINGEVPNVGNKLVVKKWSKKVSLPRVGTRAKMGSRVKITKTVSNGRETYRWLLNGKTVGKSKALLVKRSFKGKNLKMKVVTSKGNEAKSRTLNYGKIRN